MQEYQDFNVNDYVKVKLTEKGKYIYYHQFDDINMDILKIGGKPLNPIELKYDNDGYVEFQMLPKNAGFQRLQQSAMKTVQKHPAATTHGLR